MLGLVVAAALWWLYFDVVAIVAERRLRETTGKEQLTMARDSYSYLHLPMVAGIVLGAVGLKKTLGDVGDPLKTRARVRALRRRRPVPRRAHPLPAAERRAR